MDASEWSYLAKYPRALEKLASEKMDFLDFIFSYLQSSYEFAPVTTLRLLWLLASFGLLEERRHQESLQALFYDKRNTEVDETLSPENSKAVNELREKVLCAISQNKKNNGSIDAQDAVEKTRPQSEDEARSPLLAAFASPQKKNWLRSRLPFPAS
jgi:hypothetical protein